MRVRVSDPDAVRDLGEFLRGRVGAIVEQREEDTLEVSLLGSFNDAALRGELESAVRRWTLARQTGALVEIS
jgi:hypothetical protein